MNYSIFQLAVFDFIQNKNSSAIVDAKAGSGKTTTIVEACNRIDEGLSILFLAFNKSIVNELKSRLPSGVSTLTFNSVGHRAWTQYLGVRFIKLDAKKNWRIIWDNFTPEDQRTYGSFCAKMVGLAKSSCLTPNSPDSDWWAIQDKHGVLLNSADAEYERAIHLAKRVLQESIDIAGRIIDFDDQLYMPWLRNACFNKFDVVFIDEAQDTNLVQVELLKRMIKPGGRLIAVGDPNQAIYGFRGAMSDSMDVIQDTFNCMTLPLSISYRCAKSIINNAQEYVPNIESFENSSDGQVEHIDKYDIKTFGVSDAILCRNNAPLISIAYQFIARGKSVNFLGRDIGGGLKVLIKNMEAHSIDDLSEKLVLWLEKETEKLMRKRQEDKVGILEDRIKCIETFICYLPESRQTIGDLLSAIDSLFRSNGRGITLSSIHKSKGKEWNRVFILGFDKYMPSKYAKKDWQVIQETNLIYVAITRAKSYLGYIKEDCWTDDPNLVVPKHTRKCLTKRVTSGANMGKISGFNPLSN